MTKLAELEVGQWWAYQDQADFRRFKITALHKHTVHYLEVYATGQLQRMISSRAQWEFEADIGKAILTTQPDWKVQDESQTEESAASP